MYVCFIKDGIKKWSFNFIAKKLGFHNIKQTWQHSSLSVLSLSLKHGDGKKMNEIVIGQIRVARLLSKIQNGVINR